MTEFHVAEFVMKATRRISRLVANEIQMAGRIQPRGLRYRSETKRMVGER